MKYECNQCDSTFTQQTHLISHKKITHKGVKYDCNQCGSNFNQKGNLNAHIKFVHEGLKYKCNQCVLMYCTTDVIAGESKQY